MIKRLPAAAATFSVAACFVALLFAASLGTAADLPGTAPSAPVGDGLPETQETENFRATARHSGTGPSGQASVIIQITRWSTDEERNYLAQVLVDEGSNPLAAALNEQEDVGFIRFPSFRGGPPSTRLRYARQFRNGDQRTIILATDRPIGWIEAVVRPSRTYDNQITLIQLTLDADGNGEGVLAVGVEMEVDPDTNTLTITNVSSQPVRLTNVQKSN